MQEEKTKPQLTNSMIEMMSKCGIAFQRRYGVRFGCWHKEEIIPPSIAMATGTVVHRVVEHDLRSKLENKELAPRDQIRQAAADEFEVQREGGFYMSDDEAADIPGTLGTAKDQAIGLCELHHDHVAPKIQPVAVEEKFVLIMDRYPVDLAGQIDIREAEAIRDTKTTDREMSDDCARSLQMGMYCLGHKVIHKRLPAKCYVDQLIKTKILKTVPSEAVPDNRIILPVLARVERAIEVIESVREGKGFFSPADPGIRQWVCTAKFCGYHSTCKYWSGR